MAFHKYNKMQNQNPSMPHKLYQIYSTMSHINEKHCSE